MDCRCMILLCVLLLLRAWVDGGLLGSIGMVKEGLGGIVGVSVDRMYRDG